MEKITEKWEKGKLKSENKEVFSIGPPLPSLKVKVTILKRE